MEKDFDNWNSLKKTLEMQSNPPLFKEREVWWTSVGMNLGYEVFGKGEKFWRPVLILQKHNRHTFFGLPLGSTVKDSPYNFPLRFRERDGSVMLSQGRTFSSKRLANRMGWLPPQQFEAIRVAFTEVFHKK